MFLWNIQGKSNLLLKAQLADTEAWFDRADLVLLCETMWLDDTNPPNLPGYHCISAARTFRNNKAIKPSGGVAAYVADALRPHCQVWRRHPDGSYLWLRLKAACGLQDLFLCLAYVAPQSSVLYANNPSATTGPDLFESLTADVAEAQALGGSVLLAGDLNARTAQLVDYHRTDPALQNLLPEHLDSLPDVVPHRRSQDAKTNAWGKLLLELCQQADILVLNGRTPGDLSGNYTCVQPKGSSVVDYFVASATLLPRVTSLEVLPAHPDTDHNALCLTLDLDCAGALLATSNAAGAEQPAALPQRFRYKPGLERAFEEEVGHLLTALDLESMDSHQLAATLQSTLQQAAAATHGVRRRGSATAHRHQSWYDDECKQLTARLRHMLQSQPGAADTKALAATRKRLLARKKRDHELHRVELLQEQVFQSDKAFFDAFKQHGQKKPPPASPTAMLEAFTHLLNPQPTTPHSPPSSQPTEDRLGGGLPGASPFPDGDFTRAELDTALDKLKRHKAAGCDSIIAEYLLDARTTISNVLLLTLCNRIMCTGQFPDTLTLDLLHPIFKSGDASNPDNYRGIKVAPVITKLFSTLLEVRISSWAESNSLRAPTQFGFRKDHRTADALFLLRTLVEQARARTGGKLYTCFVDFRKAFDTVPRDKLWKVLERLGVGERTLLCIQAMYGKDAASLVYPDGLYGRVPCTIGVKQGCPLSPTLFGLYIDDMAERLLALGEEADAPSLAGLLLAVLLFADDTALCSTTPAGLQKQIDTLQQFCAERGLSINVKKTKIVVFANRAVTDCSFTIAGEPIEQVQDFKYLGCFYHETKGFSYPVTHLAAAARKAGFAIRRRAAELGLWSPHVMSRLFDIYVTPILNYSCEVWGTEPLGGALQALERVHTQFFKHVLRVPVNTRSDAVLAEFGRFPLSIMWHQQLVRYLNRVSLLPGGHPVNCAYRASRNLAAAGKRSCWFSRISTLVSQFGPGAVSMADEGVSVPVFTEAEVDGLFEYMGEHTTSRVWQTYVAFRQDRQSSLLSRDTYKPQPYLVAVQNFHPRRALCRFRLGCHDLEISSGARRGTPREERLCRVCQESGAPAAIEDEHHFVFHCPAYAALRHKYSSTVFRSSPRDLHHLFSGDANLGKLSNFLTECFYTRATLLGTHRANTS